MDRRIVYSYKLVRTTIQLQIKDGVTLNFVILTL